MEPRDRGCTLFTASIYERRAGTTKRGSRGAAIKGQRKPGAVVSRNWRKFPWGREQKTTSDDTKEQWPRVADMGDPDDARGNGKARQIWTALGESRMGT